jgi:LCP family protein required for cell wall assembly
MPSQKRVVRRKKKKGKRFIKFVLFLFLLFFVGVVGIGAYFAYHSISAADESYVEMNRGEKSNLREKPVQISSDPVSILLMGIEGYTDEYDQGRSDTLIVATFNPDTQSMQMLSIPRDTRVSVPGRESKTKINHAYSLGGREKTIETVEQFLDIPIDYFVSVNFNGFVNIVDILGGVKVDVPFDFYDINKDWEKFYFEEGEMELDGEAALVYARMRKKDPRGDFGRNERQQQIVKGVIDKLSTPNTLLKIDDIAGEIGANVETNLRIKEALAFRQKYENFNSTDINSLTLTGVDNYRNNIYYFEPDDESMEEIKTELKTHLELIDEEDVVDSGGESSLEEENNQ